MATSETAARRQSGKRLRLFSIKQPFDLPFLIVLMIILTVGLISLFSASYAYASYHYDDPYFFIKKQLIFALAGVVLMMLLSTVDYHVLHHIAIPLMAVAYIMLAVVLVLPARKGVHRWISLPGFQIQPSEVAKFALIVLFAHLISINHKKMKKFTSGYLPFILLLGIACGLIIVETHLSGTMLLLGIGLVMMYIGGTRLIYLLTTLGLGAGAVFLMVFVFNYERERISVWLDPLGVYQADSDMAWQTVQSLFAIGSGGIMGQGLGNSRQKHLFLPEPQNDFIFSIVCEELGLIGAVMIIVLFAVLVWRGIVIGMKAPDKFGSMLAIGLTVQVGLQVILNIAVVTNAIPNTGISLPFFSYGGSSLIMLLAQMGVVLSVSRAANRGTS